LVRFFRFQTYKLKPNRTEPVGFFKILIGLIGFFHGSVFLIIFFRFSRFNRFFDFFAHPYFKGDVRSALRSSTQCVAYVGGGVPVELQWIFFFSSLYACVLIFTVYI
jgi:hypothetical protein